MGTTLSFVTTDAAISSEMLKSALIEAADVSYNMVSVDGDTSTNDTLAIMASGYAGNKEITEKNDDYQTCFFVKSEDDVHILNSLTCGTLDHVVDCGTGNELVGSLIVMN